MKKGKKHRKQEKSIKHIKHSKQPHLTISGKKVPLERLVPGFVNPVKIIESAFALCNYDFCTEVTAHIYHYLVNENPGRLLCDLWRKDFIKAARGARYKKDKLEISFMRFRGGEYVFVLTKNKANSGGLAQCPHCNHKVEPDVPYSFELFIKYYSGSTQPVTSLKFPIAERYRELITTK